MPINDFAFQTSGSWDTTSVIYNGQNWDAARCFFVELRTDGDWGVSDGGEITGTATFVDPSVNQADYSDPLAMPTIITPIFPGRISFTAVGKPTITIENIDPDFEFLNTVVMMDGVDISNDIVALKFDIDAINDAVTGWVKYISSAILGLEDITTLYIL